MLLKKLEDDELVVTSVGAGYVGALTAITMAYCNPKVRFKVCDINQKLIDRWNRDDLPFFEPDLEEYFHQTMHTIGNIEFTTDVQRCITQGDIIFISVNTPPKKLEQVAVLQSRGHSRQDAGSETTMGCQTDLSAFMSVVREIGSLFDADGSDNFHKVLIEKSTVPLGTAAQIEKQLAEVIGVGVEGVSKYYSVVNMPEFLAEGSAIRDLVAPQRVVIGTRNDLVFELINNLMQRRKSSSD